LYSLCDVLCDVSVAYGPLSQINLVLSHQRTVKEHAHEYKPAQQKETDKKLTVKRRNKLTN